MSQYPKFLAYMFVPLGIIGFSFLIAFAIIAIRRIENAIEQRHKQAEAERKRKIRLANRGLTRNYYGLAREVAEESDASLSSDDNMDPRTLAHLDMEEEEEEMETASDEEASQDNEAAGSRDADGAQGEPMAIAKAKAHPPGFSNKGQQMWEAEPQRMHRRNFKDTFEYVSSPPSPNFLPPPSHTHHHHHPITHSAVVPEGESLDEISQRRGSLTDLQRRRLERGRGLLQTWLLAFIIVLYFVYPNLIQVC